MSISFCGPERSSDPIKWRKAANILDGISARYTNRLPRPSDNSGKYFLGRQALTQDLHVFRRPNSVAQLREFDVGFPPDRVPLAITVAAFFR